MKQNDSLVDALKVCAPDILQNKDKTRALLLDTIPDKQMRIVMIALLDYDIPMLLLPIVNKPDIHERIKGICDNLLTQCPYKADTIQEAITIWMRALRNDESFCMIVTPQNPSPKHIGSESDTMRFANWDDYVLADRAGDVPDNIRKVLIKNGQMGYNQTVLRFTTMEEFHLYGKEQPFPDDEVTIHILWDDFAGKRNNLQTLEERNNGIIEELGSTFKPCKK